MRDCWTRVTGRVTGKGERESSEESEQGVAASW